MKWHDIKEAIVNAANEQKVEQFELDAKNARRGMELVQSGAVICRFGGSLLITVLNVDEGARTLQLQVSNLGIYASKQLVHTIRVGWKGKPGMILEVNAKQLCVRELTPDDIQRHKSAHRSMRRVGMDEEGGRIA